MNTMNSVILEGNLVRDPEQKETPKGTPVCNFSVASNRFIKRETGNENEVSYFDVEVWSKLAVTCGKYLEKGKGVRVVGRLKQDRWQDGEGNNKARIKIVGQHVDFRPFFSGSGGKKGKNADDDFADAAEAAEKNAAEAEALMAEDEVEKEPVF